MNKKIRRENFYLHNYDQTKCKLTVLDYQIKIYESAKKGFGWSTKTYQKYLVKSKEACFLAVKRVCTNTGSRTPGINGFIPKTKKDYVYLIEKLTNFNINIYKAKPLKRI